MQAQPFHSWLGRLLLLLAFSGQTDGALAEPPTLSHNAGGQSSAAIQRAQSIPDRYRDRVVRDRLDLHWIDDQHLWYRVNSDESRFEWYFVDCQGPEKKLLFDSQSMDERLKQSLGETQLQSTAIQVQSIDVEGRQVVFRSAGKSWSFDAATQQLTEAIGASSSAMTSRRRIGRSRRTGQETEIVFENQSGRSVEIHWVDAGGEWKPYGSIAPGQTRAQHTYSGHVWLITDEQRRPLAVFEAIESAGSAIVDDQSDLHRHLESPDESRTARPGFAQGLSPDGKWRAEIREFNLYLIDVESKLEQALTQDGTEEKQWRGPIRWSPDSKRLIAMETRPGESREIFLIDSRPDDQLQPKLRRVPYDKPGDRLTVEIPGLFDPSTLQRIPIDDQSFSHPWSIGELRWSDDSRRFTFLYNQRGHQVVRIIGVDATSGSSQTLVEESSPTFIDYAHKMEHRYLNDSQELIWMSERDGWCHLYLFDLATGKLKNQITRGPWVVRKLIEVDWNKRQIWFEASGFHTDQDPYYVHLMRVNMDGSELVALTDGDGTHRLDFSPNRVHFVDTYSRVDQAPIAELRSCDQGQKLLTLETADASRLIESGWIPPERFVVKGRDDQTDIHGIIVRPSHFEPGKKYPIIESIYAGPQGAFVPKAFGLMQEFCQWAELGFIIVQIDGMGTSQRSKAFHDVCHRNLADAGFPDRKKWLKAAAEKHPEMDLGRVGIYGGSAGGQNALGALLFHGDFYHAAVADCGCHDNRMDKVWWNELWMGYPVDEHYQQQSNVQNAHRLQGELMLIVGELDENVDPASTLQVADALIAADKDFDLLFMTGRGHGAGGSSYGRRRMWNFFVRHLHPSPLPSSGESRMEYPSERQK